MKRKQGQFLTTADSVTTKKQHVQPCSDCPFARKAMRGWTGPHDPNMWLNIAHSDGPIDCHTRQQVNGEQWQCAGASIFRSNVCKSNKENLDLPRDKIKVFASDAEYMAHHCVGVHADVKRVGVLGDFRGSVEHNTAKGTVRSTKSSKILKDLAVQYAPSLKRLADGTAGKTKKPVETRQQLVDRLWRESSDEYSKRLVRDAAGLTPSLRKRPKHQGLAPSYLDRRRYDHGVHPWRCGTHTQGRRHCHAPAGRRV